MPVDAAGNPYTVGPNGQMIPQGQGGSPLTQTNTMQDYGAPSAPDGGGSGGGFQFDPSKSPTDPAYVRSYVDYLATLPNADPQLKNDPNYYVTQILNNGGGVTQDNANYWKDKVTNPANYGGGAGGAAGGSNGFQYGVSDFVNGPFGRYALKQAQLAPTLGAFSKGLGLSTGAMKDVSAATYGALGSLIPQDYAMQSGQFQQNFNNLNTIAGYGYNGTNAAAGYNTGAAAAGAAGTVGAANNISTGINNAGNTYGNWQLYKSINPGGAPTNMSSYGAPPTPDPNSSTYYGLQ